MPLAGFTFLSLFEELWWLTLVAVLVPWVDIWSVAAGPTEYVVEERPGIFEGVAIAFPSPGESAVVNLGPPDILFFALFLAAADRFRLRVRATWIAMTACLGGTLALVWWWDDVSGLPALPADLRRLPRPERRPRRGATFGGCVQPLPRLTEGRDGLDVRRVREHVDGTTALELVAVLVA